MPVTELLLSFMRLFFIIFNLYETNNKMLAQQKVGVLKYECLLNF